jgi:hypothetical protein
MRATLEVGAAERLELEHDPSYVTNMSPAEHDEYLCTRFLFWQIVLITFFFYMSWSPRDHDTWHLAIQLVT